jgi:flagellar biosynthesis/type III secretory pathway M-ring protein FliF/YscJ
VIAVRGGGVGATIVFAVFILAMIVLAAFVVRFAMQQNRKMTAREGSPEGSDVPAATTLDDDADDRRDGEGEPDHGGPEAEDQR